MVEVFNIKKGVYFGLLNLKAFALEHQLTSKREIEGKGKGFLLNSLLKKETEVCYNEKGKPYLKDDPIHISISHSHNQLAIIINEFESTGIDIELIRDKILKIKHKFLSKQELIDANNDVETLLIYWAAKETLYKIYGQKEVDFIEHLFVKPFTKHKLGLIIGEIKMSNFTEAFELKYQILEDYVLVYSLNKIQVC